LGKEGPDKADARRRCDLSGCEVGKVTDPKKKEVLEVSPEYIDSDVGERTIQYVNAILEMMLRTNMESLTITEREGLPRPEIDGKQVESPHFTRVFNRLRVLSDINPWPYPEPVRGHFGIRMDETKWRVKTYFDDTEGNRLFRIEWELEESNS
jgi:hypothetical protein